MEELVSIIIPVYNSEKYVGACIESFLKQTYQNIELILINDGSTDRSSDILKEYQKKQPKKIFVFDQKNQGVAKTRNYGVQCAKGKYIMFADNDDYAESDYVDTMFQEIEKTQLDMVVCSCRKVDADGNVLYNQVLTDDEWSKFRVITPWARIIRRDFIVNNHIEFGDFKLGEDSYFSVTAYNATSKIKTIPYIGYNWVQRATSVSNTTQKKGIASPLPFLDALIERNSKLENISQDTFEYFVIKFIVWNLYYICDSLNTKGLMQYNKRYFGWLKEKYPEYKKNSLLGFTKPDGEEIKVRVLVSCLVKAPENVRKVILILLARMKKIVKMK